jgi:hypothetical protein
VAIPTLLLAVASSQLPAAAAPLPMLQIAKAAVLSSEAVVKVRDRRRPRAYYGRDRGISPGVAIIGGIIIGAIIAEAIREGRATDWAMARCARQFRSFDPETGTYVTYGGEVRVCPYLR